MTTPPVPPPIFTATANSLIADTQSILAKSRQVQDDIVASVEPETANFANVVKPLIYEENHRLYKRQLIEFYGDVSPDDSLRQASQTARQMFSDFDTETALRDDLYSLIAAVWAGDGMKTLDSESRRYVEKIVAEFEQNGLALSQTDRERLCQFNTDLDRIKQQFMKAFSESDHQLWYSREELDGVPETLLDELSTADGKICLTLKGRQYDKIMASAKQQDTRRRLYFDYAKCFEANAERIRATIAIRAEKAALLGYKSFAECRMASFMEKSPEEIRAFLEKLLAKITPTRKALLEELRALKQNDLAETSADGDGKFYSWDWAYYLQKRQQNSTISHDKFSDYFALDHTVLGMLHVFERLMGLSFVGVSDSRNGSDTLVDRGLTWHKDVRLFEVWDDSDGNRSNGEFLGYLYLDLYHRTGKYTGFADLPVRPAFTEVDGSRKYTSTALICGFDLPSNDRPTLLQHREVVVLFHELGHGIHDLVAKTNIARFHGASTAGDFNEAPSQMLEQWCWVPSVLQSLSQHYSTLSPEYLEAWREKNGDAEMPEKIPQEIIDRLISGKRDNDIRVSLVLLRKSLLDLEVHLAKTKEEANAIDTTWLYHNIAQRVQGVDIPDELPPSQTTEIDLFATSGMYIYLASQVYMLDMFRTVFKWDPMSREQGLRYRRTVIGRGSSEDEMTMLTEFLGRPPDPNALFEELGLF